MGKGESAMNYRTWKKKWIDIRIDILSRPIDADCSKFEMQLKKMKEDHPEYYDRFESENMPSQQPKSRYSRLIHLWSDGEISFDDETCRVDFDGDLVDSKLIEWSAE